MISAGNFNFWDFAHLILFTRDHDKHCLDFYLELSFLESLTTLSKVHLILLCLPRPSYATLGLLIDENYLVKQLQVIF